MRPWRARAGTPLFANDLVAFVEDERFQGALKHSGVIVPVRHCTTVFDPRASQGGGNRW